MQQNVQTTPTSAPHGRSIIDTASYLGIGKSTLYEHMAAGNIRSYYIGRRRLIAETEIQRFLTERMEATA